MTFRALSFAFVEIPKGAQPNQDRMFAWKLEAVIWDPPSGDFLLAFRWSRW
jgi:hypothetical protein